MDLDGYRFYEMTPEQSQLFDSCQKLAQEHRNRISEVAQEHVDDVEKCGLHSSGGKFVGITFPNGLRPKGWVKARRDHEALIPGKRSKAMAALRRELESLCLEPRHIFQDETGGQSLEFLDGGFRLFRRGLWPMPLSNGDILGVPVAADGAGDFSAKFRWTGEGQKELRPSEVLARIEDHNEAIAANREVAQ